MVRREWQLKIARGERTLASAVEEQLARIPRPARDGGDPLNAVLERCESRARSQIERLTAERASSSAESWLERRPLLGLSVGVKDAFVVEGSPTTCGSRVLEHYLPPYTATVVERLERAGAIVVAKLNLDEFAMGSSGENSAFGPTLHPTHHDRVPGGSSSGSAAAVRAGYCDLALGSDTGGSVRLPASFCGTVGFKSTYGRLSRSGLVAFASSLDQPGVFAMDVATVRVALAAMEGLDPLDATTLDAAAVSPGSRSNASLVESRDPSLFRGLRVGVPREYFPPGIASEVRTALDQALVVLKQAGAELVPVELPHTEVALPVYYVIATSEASSNLARLDGIRFSDRPLALEQSTDAQTFLARARARFGDEVKRRILLGTFSLSAGYAEQYYAQAARVRRLVARDFERAFTVADVLVGPVAPTPAFELGSRTRDPLAMYLSDLFTIPSSLAGLPAISVPLPRPNGALPIGLHWIGPRWADARVLDVAQAWERLAQGAGA